MSETLTDRMLPGAASAEADRARSLEGFWDARILAWEDSAYGPRPAAPLARLFHSLRSSIRARLQLAAETIVPHLEEGTRVLDLGCGSATLGERLLAGAPCTYAGIDVSGRACARAEERLGAFGDRALVSQGGALNAPWPAAKIVVALGLIDWLEADEIDALFSRLAGHRFVFSYSEASPNLAARVHRLWLVRRTQFLGTPARAHHHTESFIRELFAQYPAGPVRFIRHPDMRFGVLVTNLPHTDRRGPTP